MSIGSAPSPAFASETKDYDEPSASVFSDILQANSRLVGLRGHSHQLEEKMKVELIVIK